VHLVLQDQPVGILVEIANRQPCQVLEHVAPHGVDDGVGDKCVVIAAQEGSAAAYDKDDDGHQGQAPARIRCRKRLMYPGHHPGGSRTLLHGLDNQAVQLGEHRIAGRINHEADDAGQEGQDQWLQVAQQPDVYTDLGFRGAMACCLDGRSIKAGSGVIITYNRMVSDHGQTQVNMNEAHFGTFLFGQV